MTSTTLRNRQDTVDLVLHVVQFVRPIWRIATRLFEQDRGFHSEINDRLCELESELLKWREKQHERVVPSVPEGLADRLNFGTIDP